MTPDQDMEDMPTNPGFRHEPGLLPGPKFPREPGHKSLEQLAMEAGVKDQAVLLVDAFSRVPYRVQLWIIRIKLFIERLLT